MVFARMGGGGGRSQMARAGMPGPGAPVVLGLRTTSVPVVKLRSKFPETWLWHDTKSR